MARAREHATRTHNGPRFAGGWICSTRQRVLVSAPELNNMLRRRGMDPVREAALVRMSRWRDKTG